jgi:hypothetical protein
MKLSRLTYSEFSSKLTDLNYILRSLWISVCGLALVVINAFETDSGFSGSVSLEGYIIFLTAAIYFTLNVFSRDSKFFTLLFRLVLCVALVLSSGLAFIAYEDINYFFVSALFLVAYSLVTLIILLFQTKVEE